MHVAVVDGQLLANLAVGLAYHVTQPTHGFADRAVARLSRVGPKVAQ